MFQLINKLIFTLVILGLTGCSSFPAGEVKIEEYPKINNSVSKNIELSYRLAQYSYKKNQSSFDYKAIIEFKKKGISKSGSPNSPKGCLAEVNLVRTLPLQNVCIVNQYVSFFTLYTLPFYCLSKYQAKATLKTSSGKVLKEYQLNDRAHEVWSIVIPFLLPIPAVWDAQTEEGWGEEVVKRNIAKALTRQIIHDASKFQECQK